MLILTHIARKKCPASSMCNTVTGEARVARGLTALSRPRGVGLSPPASGIRFRYRANGPVTGAHHRAIRKNNPRFRRYDRIYASASPWKTEGSRISARPTATIFEYTTRFRHWVLSRVRNRRDVWNHSSCRFLDGNPFAFISRRMILVYKGILELIL